MPQKVITETTCDECGQEIPGTNRCFRIEQDARIWVEKEWVSLGGYFCNASDWLKTVQKRVRAITHR